MAAELRERVRAQEQQAARSITAMQSEEAAWAELERRLPLAEQRARDALLRVDAASASRGTIVLVIGAGSMDVLTASGGSQTRPLSAATLGAEFRELVGASDSSDAGLWIGVRPSAAPLFDALIAAVEALGCAFHLEPIAEDQSIAFHTPERARALLE